MILIVGCGLSGAAIASRLASEGVSVHLADARLHVAGNCHTERDLESGIMIHRYGPIYSTPTTSKFGSS